jgi:hypothetical protein
MAYPLPNSSINSTYALVNYTNNVTDGWLATLLLLAVVVVTFISLKGYPMDRALAVSSFVGLLCSAFLTAMNLLNAKWLLLMIILAAFGAVYLYVNNQVEQ